METTATPQADGNRLLGAVAIALLVAVAVLGAWKSGLLFAPPEAVRVAHDPACDLRHGPCSLALPGGGSLSFGIEPRTIPVVQPLALSVAATGTDLRAVTVDFSGVDMNMGFNRFALAQQADGAFAGEGILPVCVRSRMLWDATVYADTGDGLFALPFRFETVKVR